MNSSLNATFDGSQNLVCQQLTNQLFKKNENMHDINSKEIFSNIWGVCKPQPKTKGKHLDHVSYNNGY